MATPAPITPAEAVRVAHEFFEHNSGWAPPEADTLAEWVADGVCRCPDECLVAPDAWCEHGIASWALILAAEPATPAAPAGVRALRVAALAETVSYLVLLVAVVVKYTADSPAGVSAAGPLHGVIFLAYAALVLRYRSELGWDTTRTAFALAAAVLPFGGLLVERRYLPAAAGR